LKDTFVNIQNENINYQQISQANFLSEIGNLLVKTKNDTTICDNFRQFIILLNRLFSTSELFHLKEYENTPVLFLKRYQKPHVIIQSMDSEENVTDSQINDFLKIIEEKNCHGIFISQNSGISTKHNYHIDYHRGNILIYIHNLHYCTDKITQAVDIIDNLSLKLREFNNTHDENSIPKAILDDINKEYQLFISQKEAVINVYKECQKKVLSQIDELRFPCLDKYLSTKYTSQVQKQGFKCDLCKCFNANNLKALAAHKRGCARKNTFVAMAHAL
jgi:hypothetical protein